MSYQGLQRQYWKIARERVMNSVEIKKIKKKKPTENENNLKEN